MNLQKVLNLVLIDNVAYSATTVANEIKKFAEWTDSNFDTESLCKVIHCKDCKHYKKMKKKSAQSIGSFKAVTKIICELDGKHRPANYFCADALEKVRDNV